MSDAVGSAEETADGIVRYFYDNFAGAGAEEGAFALVRFFKTHPYALLGEELQQAARTLLDVKEISQATQCLTLLATAGDRPEWNFRRGSKGHQAIPLLSEEFVQGIPMISQLIHQLGLDLDLVLKASPSMLTNAPCRGFNVFYIPEALGSPYIPAQTEFVIPYKIKSVLGFGGLLATGDMFTVICFSKVSIPLETAQRFKWLSAYVRLAAEKFGREQTFSSTPSPDLANAHLR
ncbi:MAG: hypothetical protein AAF289_13380 [Cyanobacteria bacterium P01_A01_bin.135]